MARIKSLMVAVLPTKLEALKKRALDLVADVDSIIQMKSQPQGAIDFYEEVKHFEIVLIRWALQRHRGNQAEAANLLGLRPSTLYHKVKIYGIRGVEDAAKKAQRGIYKQLPVEEQKAKQRTRRKRITP